MSQKDLFWRQRFARGLRKKQDIISETDIETKGLSDDRIFELAKEKIPLTFHTNLLEARHSALTLYFKLLKKGFRSFLIKKGFQNQF